MIPDESRTVTTAAPHTTEGILAAARAVLRMEAEAVAALADRIDAQFARAVELILECRGRIITTGIGKSGAIARKIAATFASTGTPSVFLHPAEGVHGDLGMVTAADLVLSLSSSGESDELLAILPALKRLAIPLIAMTGGPDSALARASDIVLEVRVDREACPMNLAPTTSTTAMLALGDALALAVMELRRFGPEDFALLHPAGRLGRRLLVRVADVMRTNDQVAAVAPDTIVRDALFAITRAQAGAAIVVDANRAVLGILTDGDIRRLLLRDEQGLTRRTGEVMNAAPHALRPDMLAAEALAAMQGPPGKQVGEMPVVDAQGTLVGVLNLKDLLSAGLL